MAYWIIQSQDHATNKQLHEIIKKKNKQLIKSENVIRSLLWEIKKIRSDYNMLESQLQEIRLQFMRYEKEKCNSNIEYRVLWELIKN